MSVAAEYQQKRAQRINAARATVTGLLAKHDISGHDQAHRLIQERFNQDDLDEFQAALDVLHGEGAIG